MIQEEIEKKADEYAAEALVEASNYPWLQQGYVAGWKACVDQEEWKNLYAEGIEMGRKIERSIQSGKPME